MRVEAPEPSLGDAFGRALLDRMAGTDGLVVIERDDGFVSVDAFDYLSGLTERDEWALDRAGGRVLDVGAGAGRLSLALQDRGQEVVALDVSPGAIQVCRQRGVRNVYLGSVDQALTDGMAGGFDSVLLLGNNLSLLASAESASSFLASLAALLRPGGVIVGTCVDVYQTTRQVHLDYHEGNRRRDRMAGQLIFRIRYQQFASDWFEWLVMSPQELGRLAGANGWQVTELRPGPVYAAVLRRAEAGRR